MAFITGSQMIPLLRPRPFVFAPRLLHRSDSRGFRYGHVPPRLVSGEALLRIGLDDNHRRLRLPTRLSERGSQFRNIPRFDDMRAKTPRAGRIINSHRFAVQMPALRVAMTVPRAEAAAPYGLRQ